MTLEYWREYRTFYHFATSWGIHEASVWRTIRRAEDILTKSWDFKLPGKKRLSSADHEIEFVVVDVAETPVERPKKAAGVLQRQEEAAHAEVAAFNVITSDNPSYDLDFVQNNHHLLRQQ